MKIAKVRKEETVATRKKVRKKRSARKTREEKPDTPDFEAADKPYTQSSLYDAAKTKKRNSRQTKGSVVNWFCVQDWLISGILRNNRKWFVVKKDGEWKENEQTWWVWGEKNCAERLLKHYGAEVVEKTVAWFCDNWQAMIDASDGRLSGAPSVKLLWVSRDRIFADAELGISPAKPKRRANKKRHMVGEYDAKSASKRPRIGWSDD